MKIYEVEIQRNNVSPKQFFSYCKKQFKKRTGIDFSWIESFEEWASPAYQSHYSQSGIDTNIVKPFEYHLFERCSFNFIMEFTFDEDNMGYGYMYAIEY